MICPWDIVKGFANFLKDIKRVLFAHFQAIPARYLWSHLKSLFSAGWILFLNFWIRLVSFVIDLGVTFELKLTFSKHVSKIVLILDRLILRNTLGFTNKNALFAWISLWCVLSWSMPQLCGALFINISLHFVKLFNASYVV